jgi:hypothetical protein
MLEPTIDDWVSVYGIYRFVALHGIAPLFLNPGMQVLLTIVSFGGLFGVISSFCLPSRRTPPVADALPAVTWKQLAVLLAPYAIVYSLLLIPRAGTEVLFDRYVLGLLLVALLCLVRYYQDRIQPQLPLASVLLVGVIAIYGVSVMHNMFSLYRARVALAAELRANHVPDTSVDNGWEYNLVVELRHADFLNESTIKVPPNAYVPTPPPPAGACSTLWAYDETPHIHPLYGISFDPNACYGPAPFAPMHYSRWLASAPGTLYVVRSLPPSAPSKP